MSNDPTPALVLAAPAPDPRDVREAKLKVYDRALATVSALGLIAGGFWAVYTYSHDRQKERDHQVAEAKRETAEREKESELRAKELKLRKFELDLQIFKERKDTYLALCDSACDIAASQNRQEVAERARAFFKLYNGRAHIIADAADEVGLLRIAFKELLFEYLYGKDRDSATLPMIYFGNAAYRLTSACRKHCDPRMLSTLEL